MSTACAILLVVGCAGRQLGSPATRVAAGPAVMVSAASSEEATPATTPSAPEEGAKEAATNPAFGEPTPIPGSVIGRTVRATPHFIASVVLAPFHFFWNAAKENYSDDDTNVGVVANPSAHEIRFANPASTPKPLVGKVQDALLTTYDYGERTLFFPWRLLDDAIGVIFSPF